MFNYGRKKKKKRWLLKSLKENKISVEYFEKEMAEIKTKIAFLQSTQQDQIIESRLRENPTLTFEDGHFVTHLICPTCKTNGIVTFEKQDFKVLGKDKNGFIYFECPECETHLKWNSMNGTIKSNKGILGFLFNKFSY